MIALGAMLVAIFAVQDAPPAPQEIVVTARRDKCEVRLAGRLLSNRDLDSRAAVWARGVPVRVIEPRGADQKCRNRIAMRLARRGVRLIEFIDAPPPADRGE